MVGEHCKDHPQYRGASCLLIHPVGALLPHPSEARGFTLGFGDFYPEDVAFQI